MVCIRLLFTASIYFLIELSASLKSNRVSGRVTLSQLSDNGTLTGYTTFLDSPVFVTGAVLASTTECTINEIITFNTTIQLTENQGSFL